jgi:2TM domain
MSNERTNEYDKWYNMTPANAYLYAPPQPGDPHYEIMYKEAKKRVEKKLDFYKGLGSYVITVAFLWVLAILTGTGTWPIWVMFGWGIGLAFQFADAFVFQGLCQTQRKTLIEEEMRRLRY